MDIKTWKNKINQLSFNENIKNNIITFFENFHHKTSLSLIPIIDPKLINAFNNINNYKPLSICLDIEFQSAIIDDMNDIDTNDVKGKYILHETIKNEKTGKFIREIGMLFFIKDQNYNIYYIGNIFLNFKSLTEFGFSLDNIKLIGVKYATVTDKTYNKMNNLENEFHIDSLIEPLYQKTLFENKKQYKSELTKIINILSNNYLFNNLLKQNTKDNIFNILHKLLTIDEFDEFNFDNLLKELKYIKKQLNGIQYEIYSKYLNLTGKKSFNQLNDLYWNDKLVKERLKIINTKYDLFMDLFKRLSFDSILILKGKMDIIALKNMYALIFNKNDLIIEHYYDIETFNGFSSMHFNGSQLEDTYKNLIKYEIYEQIAKPLFDQIMVNIGNKAHNPVVDSLFTIVVAIIINLGLNEYFSKQNNINGGKGHYTEYIKYKNKYSQLKK